MLRKLMLPLIAGAMLLFAIYHVVVAQQDAPQLEPPAPPARSPFGQTVAGAGLVEAQTENIAVGSTLPGVVTEVHVRVSQRVKAGEPLFTLDDRQLQADLKLREAALASARAQLQRLEDMPRPEERRVKEARVREMEATVAEAADQWERTKQAGRAYAQEEHVRRKQDYEAAREQLAWANADLELLKAGAWEPDKAVARAAVAQAEAQVTQTKIDLDRLIVRALVDGEVLQVNVRPGEYVGTPAGQALVVLGNVHRLHVRVDIDEHDIPRFQPGAPARGMRRGHPQDDIPLAFVRVEPYVVPKKSLTGDNRERVDTRVLQVIYAIETQSAQLYVGQQLDVYVDAEPVSLASGLTAR